jgi:AAA family ATP:ADP antiporter
MGAGIVYLTTPGMLRVNGSGFLLAHLQLANVLSTEQLFYACILPFIAFFGAFAFIMYPLRETLHPTGVAISLVPAAL